jgi:riboflavin-specific deaminase-like protein
MHPDPADIEARTWRTLLDHRHTPAHHDISRPCQLWDIYAPIATAPRDRPYVIAQLGQSLDGRIVTGPDQPPAINGPDGLRHLHRLRALVDAVVVGIGTILADDPRLTVRLVDGPSPARIVIDPHFRLPATAKLLADDGVPVYAIQNHPAPRPGPMRALIIPPIPNRPIPPAAIIACLADLGFRRILIEGGAHTVSNFLAADTIDRFHVTIAPVIIGNGLTGCNLAFDDPARPFIRPRTTIHRLGDDILFDCAFDRPTTLEFQPPDRHEAS